MNTKENLILVHSYPTNSILLKGLTLYLSEFFNVYFINLPGFKKTIPPLKEITFESYSRFLDEEINKFQLNHYIASGISFGFLVVNNAKLEGNCKGILAIEPFVNSSLLNIAAKKKVIFKRLVGLVSYLKIYDWLWNKVILKRYYKRITHYPLKRIKTILRETDPRTFFETAKIILKENRYPKLHKLPYVLIINRNDRTINYTKTVQFFSQNLEKFLKIETIIGHYPRKVTKEYFKSKLPNDDIKRICAFLGGYEKL